MDINTMITTCDTEVTDVANEILGKDVLDLCDERREEGEGYEAEGANNTMKQARGFRRQRRKVLSARGSKLE